jgi:hypothetical protein
VREPVREVRDPLEIQERIGEGFQLSERKSLDALLLVGGKGAAAA